MTNNNEKVAPLVKVSRISDGLGFGEGLISATEEDSHILELLDIAIQSGDGVLIQIDTYDDGCSDGREAVEAFTKRSNYSPHKHRAKIFGGSVTMVAAAKIGMGQAAGQQLSEVFESSIENLLEYNIKFGAHTDNLSHGENCGCGAIDRAAEVPWMAKKYEAEIRDALKIFGVDAASIDQVYENYSKYAREMLSGPDHYSGKQVLESILDSGSVVKKLDGEHRERRIILNQVRGMTVNQRLVRAITNGRAQVFAIDTWRLEDLAKGLYKNDPVAQNLAIVSGLVYTLATSAVLTKGDLPIDMIEPVET
ncbi:MAG TPA: hypothetical protein VLF79_04505 [Candidatus Saccharimonadales bacterium]|nr:hypothetical protein [Candidatus Saccharimonadales bacterium]